MIYYNIIFLLKELSGKYSITSGMVVALHERGKLPSVTSDVVTVSPNMATNIAFRKTEYKKLSSPYSKCRKNPDKLLPTDSEYHRETLNLSFYTQLLW